MAVAAKRTSEVIEIVEFSQGGVDINVLGTTPLILNRMSEKAKHELLLPRGGRLTTADKATRLKHDPYAEFRAAAYTFATDDSQPTLLYHLATAFKGAVSNAALDTPGVKKSQIDRLLWVNGDKVPVYGIPQLIMSVVRSADINHTPDIRTRVIVPRWACRIHISFATPALNDKTVITLLANSGITNGIGDWRQQKGSGNYGLYTLVGNDNADFKEIIATGGRSIQQAAMGTPVPYDDETEELLQWYTPEVQRRGISTDTTADLEGVEEDEPELVAVS